MDIELEKLKKLEHALHDAIDILRDWQVEETKPEEEKYIVYLAREPFKGKYCYLTACLESRWEIVQKEYGAKTKLFVGAYDEVQEWYEARDKFAPVIKAWEDGKEIQFRPNDPHLSWQECQNPSWDSELEYRVKPDSPCEDGIDPKACVGCEHSEDGISLTKEQIKQTAEKELVAYLKGCAFSLCPASQKYMAEHIEEILKASETTKELEKENAELKAHNDYIEEKLAKAKDLIGDLCYVYQLGKNELAIGRVMAEAERFLEEVKE